ncbi:MAG: DUF58 domain-containing protein [Candidatus Abyssobacteria bacterium SURF_5]|uniref:DUF58 domain-containing protein n=1 Tax=Abyssobacteria bacterium (strain SURF_5) TaxID=2093360 RepID=A0A3A4NUU6_ABYX5|nr:MAG: DUF58 domain-containing protein [Candidatus Abyssubacteria bacterium SURF_5]
MIAPQYRLLFWVACLVVPFSFVAAIQPSTLLAAEIIIGGFLILAIADALSARKRLDNIEVHLPEVIRITENKEGLLLLKLETKQPSNRRLRIGIGAPAEFKLPVEEFTTALSKENRAYEVAIPCTPSRRGTYAIQAVHLETGSPIGFWAFRKTFQVEAEVRVYPNIHKEQKSLAALFLNRGMFGLHAQRQVGKGKEFEKLRDYIPGDSYEDIHWKATAKRSHPVTKIFQIERTQEIYVVLDASRLSSREIQTQSNGSPESPPTVLQLERFITAALVLALVAEKQGDLFGLLTFHDKVHSFVRARNGKAHYAACRDALYSLQPKMVNPDFNELNSFIRLRLRRRALLIFLTNLDDPVLAETFVQNLDVLTRHHLVLVNMLKTPVLAPVFSGEAVREADDLYRRLGGHLQFQQLRELEQVLKRRGVAMNLLDNETMCSHLVSQYINVKRRQLL